MWLHVNVFNPNDPIQSSQKLFCTLSTFWRASSSCIRSRDILVLVPLLILFPIAIYAAYYVNYASFPSFSYFFMLFESFSMKAWPSAWRWSWEQVFPSANASLGCSEAGGTHKHRRSGNIKGGLMGQWCALALESLWIRNSKNYQTTINKRFPEITFVSQSN